MTGYSPMLPELKGEPIIKVYSIQFNLERLSEVVILKRQEWAPDKPAFELVTLRRYTRGSNMAQGVDIYGPR